jgi:NTP pyrophosphatase (non-canonical NTP hydrolase)
VTANNDSLKSLRERAAAFRDARNWLRFHNPKDLTMAMSIECGEVLEHFLWMDGSASKEAVQAEPLRSQVEDELADVFLYLLFAADACGIDLGKAAAAKLARNELRFPVEENQGRVRRRPDA